jgi:hypothetical protein
VSFRTGDLLALPDLSAFGEVEESGDFDVRDVPGAAAAAAQTGLAVPVVAALPRGVAGEPAYQVVDEVSTTVTFSADRVAEAAAGAGEPLPPPPPALDGSRVRLVAGPGLAARWSSPRGGVPSLIVARAVAPKAFSSGAPFEAVRDYMLSLPGLPADVAAQLRVFAGDGSTLPLPVPADRVSTSSAPVNGVAATVLTARDRSFAAVVWVDDGVLSVVAGALDADEVLAVARDLR